MCTRISYIPAQNAIGSLLSLCDAELADCIRGCDGTRSGECGGWVKLGSSETCMMRDSEAICSDMVSWSMEAWMAWFVFICCLHVSSILYSLSKQASKQSRRGLPYACCIQPGLGWAGMGWAGLVWEEKDARYVSPHLDRVVRLRNE